MDSENTKQIISCAHISKVYKNGSRLVEALHDVSFSVHEKRSLGIVGESGAGKSTLLTIMLGLSTPDTGTISYYDHPLNIHDKKQLYSFHKDVQVVFQDPKTSLNPRMSIDRIIREPLQSLQIEGNHTARVLELLDAVGLPHDALRKYPHELSGGQRQRVAIARALAPCPKVLVADEPVSALDVSVRLQIVELLKTLKKEMGLSIILVSHDLAIVAQLCEETLVLQNGCCVESNDTQAIFMSPQQEYTRTLINAIPKLVSRG